MKINVEMAENDNIKAYPDFYKIDDATIEAVSHLDAEQREELFSSINKDSVFLLRCTTEEGEEDSFVTWKTVEKVLREIDYVAPAVEEDILLSKRGMTTFSAPAPNVKKGGIVRTVKNTDSSFAEPLEVVTLNSLNIKINQILTKVEKGMIRGARGYQGAQGERG